jgi:hypothetical protein
MSSGLQVCFPKRKQDEEIKIPALSQKTREGQGTLYGRILRKDVASPSFRLSMAGCFE